MGDSAKEELALTGPVKVTEPSAFVDGLARTLGEHYRVSLYRLDPPQLLHAAGLGKRLRQREEVAQFLSMVTSRDVVNEEVGRRWRISVLRLPGSDLALVVEVDRASLYRAARVLASLADPEGQGQRTEGVIHVGDTLDYMIELAEERIGVPLQEMSRTQKQEVVRLLDEQGVFLIKKAVETVASRLGVSRFTVYNYLDQVQRAEAD